MTKSLRPPCSSGCPVRTDVRGYLEAIGLGEYCVALDIISEHNPLPSVCSWICPHPCEDLCRRGKVDHPLSIRALKRFAVEMCPREDGMKAKSGAASTGKRVAIVGAGPSGLTAAWNLNDLGHDVTIYDRHRQAGGHLYASVPVYRLPRDVIARDVQRIRAAGVNIRTGVQVGRDVSLEDLTAEYDAVILALGLQVGRSLDLPGFSHPDVYTALSFLQGVNAGHRLKVGERVVIVGGGDVAMDAARTALRIGAREVRLICLEQRRAMPANPREVEEALAEGVEILPGFGPGQAVIEEGKITGLQLLRVQSLVDRWGRFNPSYDEEPAGIVPANTIIAAVGQGADLSLLEGTGISIGNLSGDEGGANLPGVFACGEVITGPGAAIDAVASGHSIARQVHLYLTGEVAGVKAEETGDTAMGELPRWVAEQVPPVQRQEYTVLEPGIRRTELTPYEMSLTEGAAQLESERCLGCGAGARVVPERCCGCLTCVRVCPYGVPRPGERTYIDPEACQGCGLCASSCPAGAIEMIARPGGRMRYNPEHGQTLALFICRRVVSRGITPGAIGKLPGLEGARIDIVACSGALEIIDILKAFEGGAAGVGVMACAPSLCRHGGGSRRGQKLVERTKSVMSGIGMNPGRLQLHSMAGESDPTSWLTDFAREIGRMGPGFGFKSPAG